MLGNLNLNSKQKEAVEATEGPVLVIAGAGAGKTRVITERIKHLIAKGAEPSSILAVTFTNKAAEEMRERILKPEAWSLKRTKFQVSSSKFQEPFIGTFHALGLLIIRENLKKLGVQNGLTILDENDSIKLVKESLTELNYDIKQFEPARIKNQISNFKNQLVEAKECVEENFWSEVLCRAWARYEEKKQRQNSLDFDDLILKPAVLLKEDPMVLKKYRERWRYLHIDEYQDTNQAQYVLTGLLSQGHKNIMVVGDIDQAIYSWRGADFRNVLSFKSDYPDAKVITLEENYRSTSTILDAANAVIVNNKLRVPKNLWTRNAPGQKIKLIMSRDEKGEAAAIAEEIENLKSSLPLGEVAILYRTNAQSRTLEEMLLKKNIPYRIIGGVRFYERKEIKDILAYLKLIQNPNHALSLERIINVPPRKRKGVNFGALMEELRIAAKNTGISEFLNYLVKKIEYQNYIDDLPGRQAGGTEKGKERWQNVLELFTIARKIEEGGGKLGEFLEHVSLFAADDAHEPKKDRVSLMTAHSAKGLEFSAVFVAGLEEGLFPHSLSQEPESLEEERRLYYVAVTRAKSNLFLTLALRRALMGERVANAPSRFLRELPEHLLEYRESRHNGGEEYENEIIIE